MFPLKLLSNIQKFNRVKIILTFNRMLSSKDICMKSEKIFEFSVKAVQPGELIRNAVNVDLNYVIIHGEKFSIDKNVHIVGFGKAVLNMALTLENMLRSHVVSGILSVPLGMLNSKIMENNEDKHSSKLQIFEGAENNIPDENSLLAAIKISELVSSLGESSLLFVLISGGGSALLPYPKSPLTLHEKQVVTKLLASKGATIEEINIIRKRLSVLKGGGLAQLAKPAQVVSLILSDIIGDPLSLIASGPTVENTDSPSLPLLIIEKYGIKDKLPLSAIKLLEHTPKENGAHESFDFVHNFIIGNNTIVLNAAAKKAAEFSYKPIVMTNKLCGIASDVGCKIIQLVHAALSQNENKLRQLCEELNIDIKNGKELFTNAQNENLCILFGGETTVNVTGKGVGGRNQELALAAAIELNKMGQDNIVLLSAGTDGIDGPTSAAGGIAASFIVDLANKEKLDADIFLKENDSYNFYNSLSNGEWHVKVGHTGTNVMDIILVLIHSKSK